MYSQLFGFWALLAIVRDGSRGQYSVNHQRILVGILVTFYLKPWQVTLTHRFWQSN